MAQGDYSSKMSSGCPHLGIDSFCGFVSHVKKQVGEFVALRFRSWMNDYSDESVAFATGSGNSTSALKLDLEKQMACWRDNPSWMGHPPDIKVTLPKGCLSFLSLTVDVGLPPDAVYDIVTDPENQRVFKNIKEVISRKVLIDEGSRQVVEVEQAALWRFLWLTGTLSVHVLVDQNRKDYTMKFKQIKSGFMERFEGCWKMEPLFVDEDLCSPLKPKTLTEYVACARGRGRVGTKLKLEQLIQPAFVPPPPISWYLRGITTKTTEMLIYDLLAEAARIIHVEASPETPREELGGSRATDACDNIKERWRMRRKFRKEKAYSKEVKQ